MLALNFRASSLAAALSNAQQQYNTLVEQLQTALEARAAATSRTAQLQAQANYNAAKALIQAVQPLLVTLQKVAAAAVSDYNVAQQATNSTGTVVAQPNATTGSTGTR